MPHPQSSPRGLFTKTRIDVASSAGTLTQITGNSSGLVLNRGIQLSSQANATLTGDSTGVVAAAGIKFSNKANAVVTGDSTGVVTNAQIKVANKANALINGDSTGLIVAGRVKLNNALYLGANSTGYITATRTAVPTTDTAAKLCFVLDSTGRFNIGINTTGTTWKFLQITSVITG